MTLFALVKAIPPPVPNAESSEPSVLKRRTLYDASPIWSRTYVLPDAPTTTSSAFSSADPPSTVWSNDGSSVPGAAPAVPIHATVAWTSATRRAAVRFMAFASTAKKRFRKTSVVDDRDAGCGATRLGTRLLDVGAQRERDAHAAMTDDLRLAEQAQHRVGFGERALDAREARGGAIAVKHH